MKAQTPISQKKLEPVGVVGLPPTLVIIDSGVANYHILATGVHPNLEVAILEPETDGIEQITKLLAEKSVESKITAVHLISHGTPGTLYLGNSTLELNNLSRYRPQLMQWGITHLYLYGCQVAAGDAGAEFLQQLHHITKANIAASTTVTGNQDLGGNWKLESSIGNIPPDNPLSPETLTTYPGQLGPAVRVKDINPGVTSSFPSELTVFKDKLYFTANDGIHGDELWQYDGTTDSLVQDIRPGVDGPGPSELTVFNNKLYFTANDGIHGAELWQYDGTTASLVQDIKPGVIGPGPSELTVFNNKLYFIANDGTHGRELWQYDGTTASLVKDIRPGLVGSGIKNLTLFNDKLYFQAWESKPALWQYDGTTASVVKDIASFPSSPSDLGIDNAHFTVFNNKLYFQADDFIHGVELWQYDGTTDSLVKDIRPGSHDSNPSELTVFNNKLYFAASDDIHGRELWQYDGTTASVAQDIRPGSDTSSLSNLTVFNNKLYFQADDGTHGFELWQYDGTTASLVQDIRRGRNSSSPREFTVFNNKLYFKANNSLYVLNGTDTDTNIVEPLPQIAGVSIPPANKYGIGQELEFIVTFSQAVTISGEVFLPITLDAGSGVNATLVGTGESATTHTFRYTIAPGDEDRDGIEIGPELLTTDGATIVNSNGISAVLTLNNFGDTTTLLVDGIPPNAPQITPADITNGVIEGTAEPGSTVEVFRDGNAIGTTTADAQGNWTFTPETLLPEGEYNFTATATDAAGNVSVASTLVTLTVDTSSDDPVTDDSGTDDPVTGDSGTDDLGTDDSGTDDSGTDDSGTDDSGTDDSGTDDSGTDDSGTDDSGTDDSGTDDSGTDDSGTDDSGTDDLGTDDSGTDNSGTDDSGTDDLETGGESSPLLIQIFGPTGPASFNPLLVNNPVSTPLVEVASILADVPDLSNFSITLPTLPTLEITLNNTPGNPVVIGTPEPDAINGTNEAEFIQGLGGNDQIFGLEGNDIIHGNQGDDFIDAGPGDDLVHGGQGNDFILANQGNNQLYGDLGDDTLVGGPGNDFMNGNQGNDLLFAVAGNNTLHGGQGEDTVIGGSGSDVLFGDLGNDLIYAGSGNNFLYGNQGNDTLVGGDGDDVLYGGKDDDLLIGGAGNDWLFGDLGNDTLIGGGGNDRFVIRPGAGVDLIVDFTDGEDLIGLAEGLTYNDLTLTQGDNGAVISAGDELLAILNGVDVAVLDLQVFFEVV